MASSQWHVLLASFVAVSAVGCGERPATEPVPAQPAVAGQGTPVAPAAQGGGVALQASQGHARPYLVDAAGTALYALADNPGGTRCDAACEAVWPPALAAAAGSSAGPGVRNDLVGTMPRADDSQQLTFDGHLLYRYAADAGSDRAAGHGVRDQWGTWTLVAAGGGLVPAEEAPGTGDGADGSSAASGDGPGDGQGAGRPAGPGGMR